MYNLTVARLIFKKTEGDSHSETGMVSLPLQETMLPEGEQFTSRRETLWIKANMEEGIG